MALIMRRRRPCRWHNGWWSLSLALLAGTAMAQDKPGATNGMARKEAQDAVIPAVAPKSTSAATQRLNPQQQAAPALAPVDPRLPLVRFKPGQPFTSQKAAPPPDAVTNLTDAISLAYRSNPRLLAYRATLKATDHNVGAAKAAYGPTLNVTASRAYTEDRFDYSNGFKQNLSAWTNSISASLTQTLLSSGRIPYSVATAEAQVSYTRAQLRLVEAEVVLAVISDYVAVLRDAASVTIAKQNLAILEKQFAEDTIRSKVREITRADLQQVETRLATLRGTLVQAEGQLAVSQAEFLRDVGAPPGELAAPDVLHVPTATLEDAYMVADRESPLIRAAQEKEKISRASIGQVKAEFLPRVDLQLLAGSFPSNASSPLVRYERLQGQISVTIPLLDGGNRVARLGAAEENNQSDWMLIDYSVRQSRSAVATAWEQLASSRAALSYYLNATRAARLAYEGAQLQHRAGDRTTLDVLDLARDLLNVENNYNTALANEYLARANLISAMGRLEAEQLIKSVDGYSPEAHYRKAKLAVMPYQLTALVALDGLVISTHDKDRPLTDPALLQTKKANVDMSAETATVGLDRSIFAPE